MKENNSVTEHLNKDVHGPVQYGCINQIQSYLYWQSLGVPKSTLEEYKEVLLLTASHLVTPT